MACGYFKQTWTGVNKNYLELSLTKAIEYLLVTHWIDRYTYWKMETTFIANRLGMGRMEPAKISRCKSNTQIL